jgi:hypothetical protein
VRSFPSCTLKYYETTLRWGIWQGSLPDVSQCYRSGAKINSLVSERYTRDQRPTIPDLQHAAGQGVYQRGLIVLLSLPAAQDCFGCSRSIYRLIHLYHQRQEAKVTRAGTQRS